MQRAPSSSKPLGKLTRRSLAASVAASASSEFGEEEAALGGKRQKFSKASPVLGFRVWRTAGVGSWPHS